MKTRWTLLNLAPLALGGGAMVYVFLSDPPRLPVHLVNGAYTSKCCGSFQLADGQVMVADERMPYVVETDKGGAYVLPQHYVGVLDGKSILMARDKFPLKLRLDNSSTPHTIELFDVDGGRVYTFKRLAARR